MEQQRLDLPAAGSLVAQVVLLPSPAGLPESLTYLVPDELRVAVLVGAPVLVPLGGREHLGYVLYVGPLPDEPETRKLRPILSVPRPDSAFDGAMLELLRWLAREYRCTLADVLSLAVPERHGVELQSVLSLGEWDGGLPPRLGLLTRQTLEAIHRILSEAGGRMPKAELVAALPAPNLVQALQRAKKEGWIREERVLLPPRVQARTLKGVRLSAAVTEKLTSEAAPEEAETGDADAESSFALEVAREGFILTEQRRRVLQYLAERGDSPEGRRRLAQELGVSESVLQGLVRWGLLETTEVRVRRRPAGYDTERDEAPHLNTAQREAEEAIGGAISRGEGESLLLFGVTGSGKTEVYLHAIERARAAGRTAALLVPEISLTAQVAAAVRRRLGERVAILHSALSDGERFDEWERLRRGEADVVVGPRSALFAPMRSPALIILDEEHDGSYKQGSLPRYHSREVAGERARLSGGCVVLGSATPSVETFHAALTGRTRLLELPQRVHSRPLPSVEIVDLRAEARGPQAGVFSPRLLEEMRRRLSAGEQVILFLNRRGYSAFLLCRDCGHVPRCPNCDVSLTLHRRDASRLLCHHCDYTRAAPTTCERCLGARVKQFGLGTQRVEESVRQLFPAARVARLDKDTTSVRDAHTRIVRGMRDREIDILIGTQMVTKGFDFPAVTLVGVVTADVALNVPDFRAGERAFQLLTQVSGRAGRGERPGEVVIQTFNPEHPSVVAASRHDYRGFYAQEIRSREELGYPPFGSLARFLITHVDDAVAKSRVDSVAELLAPAARRHQVRLLGPAPCPLTRLKERYRWHLLLKGRTRAQVAAVLDAACPEVQRQVGGVVIDVEPVDLL
ncbi:MAG: primosomal protein N' [Armatimonadota bacterium]